jgi:hypothetical protein
MDSGTKTDKKLTNGSILIISKVLKHVMSSTAEDETGAVFMNAKEGAVLRTTLEELGHPQPPTPMETDNTNATGYSNGTIKQKRTNNGYETLLDRRQSETRTIYCVLGPGLSKCG